MSESNGATATLEQPTGAPSADVTPESQAAPQQDVGANGTGVSESTPSAVGQGEGTPDASSSAVDDTQGQQEGFDAAFAKVTGKQPEAKPEAPELPGRSLEDAVAEVRKRQASDYAVTIRDAETKFRADLERRGFTKEESHEWWTQHGRQALATLHDNNEAFNLAVMDGVLRKTLSEDEVKEYDRRDLYAYDNDGNILPYETRRNQINAALAFREKTVNEQWQAKVEKGELLTRDQGKSLYEEGIAAGERRRDGAESGRTPPGTGAVNTSGPWTAERAATASIEEIQQARAQGLI